MAVNEQDHLLTAIQVYAQQRLPAGVRHVKAEVYQDVLEDFAGSLVAMLLGVVYGLEGEPARVEHVYGAAAFPRWIPRWLRRRWTVSRSVVLDATPLLVFPEMTHHVPEFGEPAKQVRWFSQEKIVDD